VDEQMENVSDSVGRDIANQRVPVYLKLSCNCNKVAGKLFQWRLDSHSLVNQSWWLTLLAESWTQGALWPMREQFYSHVTCINIMIHLKCCLVKAKQNESTFAWFRNQANDLKVWKCP